MFMSELKERVNMNFGYPVAKTRTGMVRGIKKGETYIFRGIKYADSKRFHMPEAVKPWEGIKDAISYACVCPELLTPVPGDQQLCPHYYLPQDEDCQFVNIWSPSLDERSGKPVMVWFHGGGWYGGSGVEQYAYDGENLSSFGDVVVVTLNHRLNCLGYMDLSSFGSEYENSNLSGLADLVMALKWVNENISSFGGNPDNVTIFGQSGGGGKVMYLMQTPEADGLYERAIVQSGGMKFFGDNNQPAREMSERLAELTVERLGIEKKNISDIEKIPYWDLAEAVMASEECILKEYGSKFRWEPLPDGRYFLGNPILCGFRKETRQIPMIIGGTFGESSSNSRRKIGEGNKNDWDEMTANKHIREQFGENSEAIIKVFKEAYPENKIADVLFIDRFDRFRMVDLIKKRVEDGGKTWNYIFKLESPINSGTIAWHCSDIPFFFHNADYIEAAFIPGVSEALQDIMAGAWASFAWTGNPNSEGIPYWPEAKAGKLPTMLFDSKSELVIDHDKKLLSVIPKITGY